MNIITQARVGKISFPLKVPKILVVEDDPTLAEVLEEFFRFTGYKVHISYGSEDIVELSKQVRPDLILLDYLLPRTTGGEICRELKANEETECIPVIIYSAFSKAILSPSKYGCDSFLPKPFELNDLIDQIETLLARSSVVFHTPDFS